MSTLGERLNAIRNPATPFEDGRYFAWRKLGAEFQIHTRDLTHVAFADVSEVAEAICEALNIAAAVRISLTRDSLLATPTGPAMPWLLELPMTDKEWNLLPR